MLSVRIGLIVVALTFSAQVFADSLASKITVIPSGEIDSWIEKQPLYAERMAAPDSPEKELFLELVKRARLHRANNSSRPDVFTIPNPNPDRAFFLMLAYAAETLQRGGSRVDPRIVGQLTALTVTVLNHRGSLNPRVNSQIEIVQRFILAALALGITSPAEIARWSEFFVLDDLLTQEDLMAINKSERTRSLQFEINSLFNLGIPYSLGGTLVNPLWRFWTGFDLRNFSSSEKTSIPKAATELLIQQRVVSERDMRAEEQKRDFLIGMKARLNFAGALSKTYEKLDEKQKAELISLAVWMFENHPKSPKTLQQGAAGVFTSEVRFTVAEWGRIYSEILRAGAQYAYESREQTQRERAADQTLTHLSQSVIRDEVDKQLVDSPVFATEFDQVIQLALSEGVAQGLIPAPSFDLADRESLKKYIHESLRKIQRTHPILQTHLLEMEDRLRKNRSTRADYSGSDFKKELESLEDLQAELIAIKITESQSNLSEAVGLLSPDRLALLESLELNGTAYKNAWVLLALRYNEGESDRRSADSDLQRLKKAALRIPGLSSDEALVNVLKDEIVANIAGFMTDIPEDYRGENEAQWQAPVGGLKSGQMRAYRSRIGRVALAFVHHKPANTNELQEILRNAKKMKKLTGEGQVWITDSTADQIYHVFYDKLAELLNRASCSSLLARNGALLAQ